MQRHRSSWRVAQAACTGLLLLAAVTVVLLNSASNQQAPVSTVQQQLQFMYAAPGGIPVQTGAVAFPLSPTLLRAAGAVARAKAAIGTADLRRAFSRIPGITAASVMPAGYGLPMAGYGVAPEYATGYEGTLGYTYGISAASVTPAGYGVPMAGYRVAPGYATGYGGTPGYTYGISTRTLAPAHRSWAAAYHVSIPAGVSLPFGSVPYASPSVSVKTPMQTVTMSQTAPIAAGAPVMTYGVPVAQWPNYGYGGGVPLPQSPQDNAVNFAINAGARAAAGAGFRNIQPQTPVTLGNFPAQTAVSLPYATIPSVSQIPMQGIPTQGIPTQGYGLPGSVVVGAGRAGVGVVAAANGGAGVAGIAATQGATIQRMKIVAGPGKGRFVDVTASGKILGESPTGGAPTLALPDIPNIPKAALYSGAANALVEAASATDASAPANALVETYAGPTTAPSALSMMPPSGASATPLASGEESAAGTQQRGQGASESRAASLSPSLPPPSFPPSLSPLAPLPAPTVLDLSSTPPTAGTQPAHAEGGSAATQIVRERDRERERPERDRRAGSAAADSPHRAQLALSANSLDNSASELRHPSESARDGQVGGLLGGGPEGREPIFEAGAHPRAEEEHPQVRVTVPKGKRPGDFFSAQVPGRGLMLVEVPENVGGGDSLQLMQKATSNGMALEWVKFAPMARADAQAGSNFDALAAKRSTINRGWNLGNVAPRSYFH